MVEAEHNTSRSRRAIVAGAEATHAIEPRASSRRGFLRSLGLGAAGVVAGAPIARGAPSIIDDADMLTLGRELDGAQSEMRTAAVARRAARSQYEAAAPAVPDEIAFVRFQQPRWLSGDAECDFDGHIPWSPDSRRGYRVIISANELAGTKPLYHPRSREGRSIRVMLPIAERYERAVADARASAGLNAADEVHYWALRRVEDAILKIVKIEPQTVAGLSVLGRAWTAYVALGRSNKQNVGHVFGDSFPRAIARVAAGVA